GRPDQPPEPNVPLPEERDGESETERLEDRPEPLDLGEPTRESQDDAGHFLEGDERGQDQEQSFAALLPRCHVASPPRPNAGVWRPALECAPESPRAVWPANRKQTTPAHTLQMVWGGLSSAG